MANQQLVGQINLIVLQFTEPQIRLESWAKTAMFFLTDYKL